MIQNKIDAYIDSHVEEMLEDVKTLVRVDSRRGEALPGKPYGEGPAQVLAEAEKMMQAYGFSVKNYDNYVVTGDFNDREKNLDILAHLDVVPVTPDWTVTQPFDPIVVDGKIYGRGTADDKGPAIAALYAMRALKECGVELKKNVRLILGADEECGSSDLKHYYALEKEAPMTFTPDADFPLINIEKGQLQKKFTTSFAEETLVSEVVEFHGGDKVNVVPASAWATIRGLEKGCVEAVVAKEDTEILYTVTEEDGLVKIQAKGIAAHASTPEMGKNAVCALLGVLSRLPLAESKKMETLKSVAELFPYGDCWGEALGVKMEDEISGKLTMNLGIFHLENNQMEGTFDSRISLCGNDENVTNVIREKMKNCGLTMEEGAMVPPHHVPADSDFVKTLLESYEKYSGQKGKTMAIGGGTYVHELERGVAFGCMMDDVDNHMHGDDEFMVIDVLIMSAKIFADAILKLCM